MVEVVEIPPSPVCLMIGRWRMLRVFLCWIGEKRVFEGVEDTIRWTRAKNSFFMFSLGTERWCKELVSLFPESVFGRIVFNRRCLSLLERLLGERS